MRQKGRPRQFARMVGVLLTPETDRRVRAYALLTGSSISELIRDCVEAKWGPGNKINELPEVRA